MERFTIDENNYVRDAMNGNRICGPRMKRKVDALPGREPFKEPTREEAEKWANTANGVSVQPPRSESITVEPSEQEFNHG